MEDRKFGVFIQWNYRGKPKEQFERCSITPVSKEDEKRDGENCISGYGSDGYTFNIYPSLKEAILNAGFNPFAIQFDGLTEEEQKEKGKLLSRCTWTPESGIKIMEQPARCDYIEGYISRVTNNAALHFCYKFQNGDSINEDSDLSQEQVIQLIKELKL